MAYPFDSAAYVRAPVITVSSGVSLAFALVDACPKDADAQVKKAAKKLKATAEKSRDALAARNRELGVFADEDTRILDNEADHIWGGGKMRLQGLAMLPQTTYPRAKRAAELDVMLFAGGTEFLKAEYAVQSTEMGSILQRIQEDKLEAELNDLIGPEFLKAMKDVQPRYEAMVKERLRRDKASGQNLMEMVRGFRWRS